MTDSIEYMIAAYVIGMGLLAGYSITMFIAWRAICKRESNY